MLEVTGRIIRKKKRRKCMELAVKPSDVHSIPMFVYDSIPSYLLFLNHRVHVRYDVLDNQNRAKSIKLLECAGDPHAVQKILEHHDDLTVLFPNSDQHPLTADELNNIRTTPVPTIVKRLNGTLHLHKNKAPWVPGPFLQVLEQYHGHGQSLRNVVPYAPLSNTITRVHVPVHLPDNIPEEERLDRTRYFKIKKEPQIQWMVHRLSLLPFSHILDVGGGRGDLTLSLARTFTKCRVTLLDCHQRSLDAARQYATSEHLDNRVSFLCQRFCPNMEFPGVDFVVALHACGDLTDQALSFAVRCNIGFLICPCCFTKTSQFVPPYTENKDPEHIRILQKLSELQENPEVGSKARHVINSWRVEGLDHYDVSLELYDGAASARNMVLVGHPRKKMSS